MKKYVVAGVGVADGYTIGNSPQPIFTSNTLQEQALSLGLTAEDIRGGMANKLIARYFHDSLLECNLTDATFSLEYLALNAGATIQTSTDSIVTESAVVGTGGTVTVSQTPVKFGDSANVIGWVSVEGEDEWTKVTFTDKTAQTTLEAGTNVCVRYDANDAGMRYFNIPANVIPSIIHLYMTYPLFSAGGSEDVASKTQVGEVVIDIPRFQLSGTADMSLTSSGAATSNLSGQALAKSNVSNCQDMSNYAKIGIKLYDSVWYDDLEEMAVDGAEFTLAVDGTKTLRVIGIYKGGATGDIPNELLSFTSDGDHATVVGGVVTGVSAGVDNIEIKPTQISGKPAPAPVAAYAEVTVTA